MATAASQQAQESGLKDAKGAKRRRVVNKVRESVYCFRPSMLRKVIQVQDPWLDQQSPSPPYSIHERNNATTRIIKVEATVRYAAELGYEATMAKDTTADYSDEEMHAALDVNIPNYANAIVTTDEIVASILLSKLSRQFYILKG